LPTNKTVCVCRNERLAWLHLLEEMSITKTEENKKKLGKTLYRRYKEEKTCDVSTW